MSDVTEEIEEDAKMVVEIDPETGLPVLPDNMLWRVCEAERYSSYGYYDRHGRPKLGKVTEVQLVRTGVTVTKIREVPVHGDRWWNRKKVVGQLSEPYEVIDEVVEFHEGFKNRTNRKKWIPEIAVNLSRDYTYEYDDREGDEQEFRFDIPVTEDGVAWLAEYVWRAYMRRMWDSAHTENEARENAVLRAKEDAVRDRLLGDYPPKKLTR